MKKYVVGLLLLFMHNMFAMELATLSSEDDAKALRFAKLFNKYPKGYGDNTKCIDMQRDKIHSFLEQIDSLSLSVKKYQKVLKHMEAVEVLDFMHEALLCDVKSVVFTAALYDDAAHYYATNNALKLVEIEPKLAPSFDELYTNLFGYYIKDWYIPYFLDELCGEDRYTMCFCKQSSSFLNDFAEMCHYSIKHENHCSLSADIPYTKEVMEALVSFVDKDTKKMRVEAFKKLFAGWIEYLSNEKDKATCMYVFIELLEILDVPDDEEEDCRAFLKRESKLKDIVKSCL